jgi:hypothetical protein
MTNNQFAYHVSDHSHQLAQKTWTQVQDQCLKSFAVGSVPREDTVILGSWRLYSMVVAVRYAQLLGSAIVE